MAEIKSIGVIGAGQMGRGIAQVAAQTGYQVVLFDVSEESLNFGYDFIKKQLDKGVAKEKWDQATADTAMAAISKSTDLNALKDADLIVEAATENKKIKFEIFKNGEKFLFPF